MDRVERVIAEIVGELRNRGARRVILFGSRARGDHRYNSDIDLAVDLDLSFREKRQLKEVIDELSGLYSVDLVFLGEVEEDFKRRILEEGRVLYEEE